MIRFAAAILFALLPSLAMAQTAIIFEYDPGATLYARLYTSSSAAVAVAFTAGTSGNTRLYTISESALTGAGLTPSTVVYPFTVFTGTPSTSASDPPVGAGATVLPLVVPNANDIATATKTAIEQVGSMLQGLSQRALLALPPAAPGNPGGLPRVSDLPEGGAGGGLIIPVSQVVVPDSRRFILEQIGTSLIAKLPKGVRVGEPAVFAIDFRNDLAANGRLVDLDAVQQVSGPTDGMAWSLAEPQNAGIDKQSGILRLEATEAGTFVLDVTVSLSPQDGGGQSTGRITIVAVE